ncbi:hypothetical protein Syun_027447 [Stephania yunnanensis]|uniref:Uncharacterized protein n=1 Tax=Stephania yunnanensis TaxID=152371 RepID=A0AAP0HQ80_9MAGN
MKKKLLHISYNGFKGFEFSRVFRASLYSTKTQISSSSNPDLYRRISPLGDPSIPISPVLDKWVEEGNSVDPLRIRSMIKQLREYRRFTHALESIIFRSVQSEMMHVNNQSLGSTQVVRQSDG